MEYTGDGKPAELAESAGWVRGVVEAAGAAASATTAGKPARAAASMPPPAPVVILTGALSQNVTAGERPATVRRALVALGRLLAAQSRSAAAGSSD
ncbi:hypothetical protein GCM10009609_35810 [Pseudonocardia aurantiaca]